MTKENNYAIGSQWHALRLFVSRTRDCGACSRYLTTYGVARLLRNVGDRSYVGQNWILLVFLSSNKLSEPSVK